MPAPTCSATTSPLKPHLFLGAVRLTVPSFVPGEAGEGLQGGNLRMSMVPRCDTPRTRLVSKNVFYLVVTQSLALTYFLLLSVDIVSARLG